MTKGVDWFFNPFQFVIDSFEALYPDKPCSLSVQPFDCDDLEGAACTGFPEDGGPPHIIISHEAPYAWVVETLAHELAHVAVGVEHDHDEIWESAFDSIHTEYERRISDVMCRDPRYCLTPKP